MAALTYLILLFYSDIFSLCDKKLDWTILYTGGKKPVHTETYYTDED
jgi:hypothetical protein